MARKATTITNPAATRLPRQLGTFADSPETPGPIRPVQIPKHRQLRQSEHVKISNPKAVTR